MAGLPFLDTNLFLRHLTQDHPEHSRKATALWHRIAGGDQTVEISDTVVFETIFTRQRFYQLGRAEIAEGVLPLLTLNGVRLPEKGRYQRAFALYVSRLGLSSADCFHIAVMESRGLTTLISFDRGFRQVSTITRQEPDDDGQLR